MDTPDARSTASRLRSAPGFRTAAKAGFAVNGLLNIVIGFLAIGVAVSGAGGQADQNGALRQLAEAPGGMLLIWVIAIGLIALGLWQATAAVLVTESDRKKRAASRLKNAGKAVAYLAIGASAVGVATGGGGGGGGEETLTAKLLATPGGVILLVAIGLGAIGVGIYMVVKGVKKKFLDDLNLPGGTVGRVSTVLGMVGYIARGIAIAVVGILFIVAAVTADPEQAGGLDAALASLAALPFGTVVLIGIGLGFIAYGVYSGVRARYARI